MLIQFSVSNFRSINSNQIFSLVATSGAEMRDHNVMNAKAPATPDVVRSAVIYGPNAAGKSNLILALAFVKQFVLTSSIKKQMGDEIEISQFLFSKDEVERPSEFEVVFVENEVRYQYGFALTKKEVKREWLYAYPKGSPQCWFERNEDVDEWYFGPSFKGQKNVWKEATRNNSLFLSTAVQLNAEQLMPVFNWFRNKLQVIAPDVRLSSAFSAEQCDKSPALKKRVLGFLNTADLGIKDVDVERRKFDSSMVPDEFPEELKNQVIKELSDSEYTDVSFSHKSENGVEQWISLEEQSGGTQKLFSLAGPWIDVLENGLILVVDELDTSLHPLIMRNLVGMFNNKEVNAKGAQLIFSTHDTSILDKEVFRRDQVWLVEKNASLQSQIYSLVEFSPRKGENLEKGYLDGRYGALPFVGEWKL